MFGSRRDYVLDKSPDEVYPCFQVGSSLGYKSKAFHHLPSASIP